MRTFTRRNFLRPLAGLPLLGTFYPFNKDVRQNSESSIKYKLRLSLNAYSFHRPLTDKKIDLFDVLDFCVKYQFDAIDPTGYYFPGYPSAPDSSYIREFKRKAFLEGIEISGTGIRNDFANPDVGSRENDILLIETWLGVAAQLGAPVLRIFPGHHPHDGYSREEVMGWMVKDIMKCGTLAEQHGVLLAVQNHNGFLKTADDVNQLMSRIPSPWVGQNLDIGSYRQHVPYDEIQKNIHHAITWQIKENVWIEGDEIPTDFNRLFRLIKSEGYRGYLPLETLGSGDPFEKVPKLLEQVKSAWEQ